MNNNLTDLLDKKGPIRNIGVIGMGYVGIPAAVLFADSDAFDLVWGFQRDSPSSGYKIDLLNRGESPLKGEEPGLEDLINKVVKADKFRCTSDFSKISEVDAVTLAIQTPFANVADLEPDFSALIEGVKQVGRYLSEGTLVVLESTITPGTTEGLARQVLEAESGLCAGKDFALARKVNDFMPVHMYNLTVDALKRIGKTPAGSKVAILGWAFINNSDDARNPPSEPYRDLLIEAGCSVSVHDPHVLEYPGVDISHELSDVVKGLMGQEHPVIVDGRNVVDADEFVGAGFVYKGIGRGDKNGHDRCVSENYFCNQV